MIIGITGSSGAGKSTVCEILEKEYQAKIINSDKIARELSQKGSAYLNDIVTCFGKEILLENGELDRKKLADLIYHHKEKREQLNQCTFRYIVQGIQKEIQKHLKEEKEKQSSTKKEVIIAIDAPLLMEAKLEKICDTTIAVVLDDRELQVQRIMERDHIQKEQALARLSAQKSNEFYIDKCQYTITNHGDLAEIQKQLEKIMVEVRK